MNPDDYDVEEAIQQIDEDFKDYKEKMAMGAYPEAEKVEEDVRHMQEVNPDADEEASRKLAVAYYAAIKRIRRRRRESVVEDLAEPMMRELFNPGPDYTCCYSSQGLPLIRPENARAQKEFDDNVAEYSYHLQRWYNADGTSEWFKPNFSEPAIFLNPKHDCNELVVKLRNKGFRLVL